MNYIKHLSLPFEVFLVVACGRVFLYNGVSNSRTQYFLVVRFFVLKSMEEKYKVIKDIKVRTANILAESLVLINGESLPCSSIKIIEKKDEWGKLVLEIPLVCVEIMEKKLK